MITPDDAGDRLLAIRAKALNRQYANRASSRQISGLGSDYRPAGVTQILALVPINAAAFRKAALWDWDYGVCVKRSIQELTCSLQLQHLSRVITHTF